MKPYLMTKWEDIDYAPKLNSQAFESGQFISYNGLGFFKPLAPTEEVLGQILTNVTSGDDDYAENTLKPYQRTRIEFKFVMKVVTGTATSAMVGLVYDIGAGSAGLDVSGVGTQFILDTFIDASTVVVRPALVS